MRGPDPPRAPSPPAFEACTITINEAARGWSQPVSMPPPLRRPQPWWSLRQKILWHWPLAVVLLVAGFLRFWDLLPPALYGDDAEYVAVASYLTDDPRRLQYPDLDHLGPHPFVSQPPALLYLFALMGHLVGDAANGAVLTSALLGTATCGLLYAIGLVCHGRAAGASAGLILAFIPIHVDLSRRAFLDAGLVFFMTLSILFLLLWLERRTMGLAAATGAAAALAVFSKLPGFLILAPLLAALLLEVRLILVARRDPDTRVAILGEARRLVAQAGIAATPTLGLGLAYFGLLHYLRATRNLLDKLGWQAERVAPGSTSAGFVTRPWDWYLTDAHYGLPAQLGFFLTLACIAGFVVLFHVRLLRVQHTGRFALLVWPMAVVAFFTLAQRKEWFYILPAAPPLALLCGLAIGVLASRAERIPWPGRWNLDRARAGLSVGAAFLLLALPLVPPGAASIHALTPEYRAYGSGFREAAGWIAGKDPEAAQVGTILGRFSLHHYNGQPTYHYYVNHTFLEQEARAGRLRFVVMDDYIDFPEERRWMADFVRQSGAELVWTFTAKDNLPHVWIYEVRPPTTP